MRFFKSKLFIVLVILSSVGIYTWSIWPGTTIMPPSWIIWRLNMSIPPSEPDTDWEKRGEYIVTISGCGMCHTPYYWHGPDGNMAYQGGMRVRWSNRLGERITQNITPDKETGIGNWSEEDFIIAMKSGLYPDGTDAHWQAMPWDMHSNWSLDDLRAMYRYLMQLEPKKLRPTTPINEPLPEADTFYFGV